MNELKDFFSTISKGKREAVENDPKLQFLKQLKESLREDNPFLHAAPKRVVEKKPELIQEQPDPVQEQVLTEVIVPEVKPAAQQVSADTIDKYLRQNASFQQPDPDKVDPNIPAIQNKLKFLEQAIGKIAALGPGGGAGEIYNLDMPTTVVTGDYSMSRKDYYVGVNATTRVQITLPTQNIKAGRVVVVKDESGRAQITPIKIVGTIDNDPDGAEIRVNNAALQFIYRDGWRII